MLYISDNGERKIFPDGMSQFNSKEWQSAGMNHRYQSLRKSVKTIFICKPIIVLSILLH